MHVCVMLYVGSSRIFRVYHAFVASPSSVAYQLLFSVCLSICPFVCLFVRSFVHNSIDVNRLYLLNYHAH